MRGVNRTLVLVALANSRHVRFLCGGAICAGINNVILIAGDHFGAGYIPLTFLYYLVSGSIGYWFHARITFRHSMSFLGYANFILGLSLGLPVSLVILAALARGLDLPMWISAPTMTALMTVYNYVIAKLAIAPRHPALTGM